MFVACGVEIFIIWPNNTNNISMKALSDNSIVNSTSGTATIKTLTATRNNSAGTITLTYGQYATFIVIY